MSKNHKGTKKQEIIKHRREFIAGLFTAAGGIGLQSLLLGLPPAFLARRAMAAEAVDPTFLVFTSRRAADPVNANVPGTYINGIIHNRDFPGVDFNLGNVRVKAAKPWADLPQGFRSHLNFFHLQTGTSSHNETENVIRAGNQLLGLGGAGLEMLPSAIAQHTSVALGTTLERPIDLNNTGWTLRYKNVAQPRTNPVPLKNSLVGNTSTRELDLQKFRDQKIDELYKDLKSNGTPAQIKFLERNVASRQQARELTQKLSSLLSDVNGNSTRDRMRASAALFLSRTAPAVVFGLDFGGDNHKDAGLNKERDKTRTAVADIGFMYNLLDDLGIANQTTFAQMNVFGRTLGPKGNLAGRDHHRRHNTLVLYGPKVKPGVTGGINSQNGKEGGRATGINSVTGTNQNPDIKDTQTLAAGAATVMRACGVTDEDIKERLPSGKVVKGSLILE